MSETNNLREYGIFAEKDRPYENVAYVMALVYQICEKRIARVLAGYGISPEQFNVLTVLRFLQNGDGMSQVEIGKHLIVSAGSITRLVDKLSKEKLVTVRQNKNNRRENIVKITQSGCSLIDRAWPEYDGAVKSMVGLVPADKQKELADILAAWFLELQKD